MRVVSAVAALLYRLRDERAIVAIVFAVVAVTSFAVAAAPRLFERVADAIPLGRRAAEGRSDDAPEAIRNRLRLYH